MTTAEDIIKFRDAKNNAIVLCEYIPAKGDQEERWQQYYLNMGDYEVGEWKAEMYRVIEELDLNDNAKYAWMENAPEPLPQGIEDIVLTEKAEKVVVDGVIYIVRDNKLFNLQVAIIQYPPRSNTAHRTGRLASIPSLPVLCGRPHVSVNYAFRRYAPKRNWRYNSCRMDRNRNRTSFYGQLFPRP